MLKTTYPRDIRVLVTGGPTRAYLDRVRFLSNISTGELAYRICRSLIRRGVRVAAVVGPTSVGFESLALERLIRVETHGEMLKAVLKTCRQFKPDFGVFAAAVLDFEPVTVRRGKVSSSTGQWVVRLKATAKILDEVSARFPALRKIGFKLECHGRPGRSADRLARNFMRKRSLEALCLNFLHQIGPGRHRAYFFGGKARPRVLRTKQEIAESVSEYVRAAY